MFRNKIIFYGALDWGLGHATRSVPIIRELLKNNTVVLGVTPLTRLIYDEEFPDVKKIDVPPYNVKYSKVFPLWIQLGLSAPRITRTITRERKQLQTIIRDNRIDVVISDNRFGLHSDRVPCIFITHQLFLKAPVLEGWGNKLNQKYISSFNEVWVPDFENEGESLSGELSHGDHFHNHVKYIGPQSRLKNVQVLNSGKTYDYLLLISGPEPTRTELEAELLKKAGSSSKKIALVRGSKFNVQGSKPGALEIFDLPSKEELKSLILSSDKIICRSGYSTLMDMYEHGKKDLILIPTPGQSEQDYLAGYWKKKFGAQIVKQNEINKLINFTS